MNVLESYNIIDICILCTLLVTVALGLWKGFIRSLTALASLVIGVVGAMKYHTVIQPYLSKVSSLDPHISTILSMAIIFVLVQIAFVILRWILDALLDLTRLTWLDRICGAAMGLAGGLLISAAVVQAILIGIPDWPLVKTSKLIGPVDQLAVRSIDYAPKQAKDRMQSLITKWKGTQEPGSVLPQRETAPSQKAPSAPPAIAK